MSTGEKLSHAVDAYFRVCREQSKRPKVRELAAQLGISRFRLGIKFRQQDGITLEGHFEQRRLMLAFDLLRNSELSIEAIARQLGYREERNFRRAFKRITGITPAAYRRACHIDH